MKKSSPAWWQATIYLPEKSRDAAALLSPQLIALGTTGVEELYQKRKLLGLRAHYNLHLKKTDLLKSIRLAVKDLGIFFPNLRAARVTVIKFTDQSWKDKWKKYAKPILISPKLAILPHHYKQVPKTFPVGCQILRLDPGLAFGTGSHASTFLCLKAFVDLAEKRRFKKCLDVGTGSGILAIAAKTLGVPIVLGVDNDPMAVDVAGENARAHRLGPKIKMQTRSIEKISGRYDLIFANILLNVLVAHAHTLAAHLAPGGVLVLSGLLARQDREMRNALRRCDMKVVKRYERKGWICLVAEKRS